MTDLDLLRRSIEAQRLQSRLAELRGSQAQNSADFDPYADQIGVADRQLQGLLSSGALTGDDLNQAFQNAYYSGADLGGLLGGGYTGSDELIGLLGGLGYENNWGDRRSNAILHRNPSSTSGAYRFDPYFGSEYFRDELAPVLQQYGISDEQARASAAEFMRDKVIENQNYGGGTIFSYRPSGLNNAGNYLADLGGYILADNNQRVSNPDEFNTYLRDRGNTIADALFVDNPSGGYIQKTLNTLPAQLGVAALTGGLASTAGLGATATGATVGGATGAARGFGETGTLAGTLKGGATGAAIGGALGYGAERLGLTGPTPSGDLGTGLNPSAAGQGFRPDAGLNNPTVGLGQGVSLGDIAPSLTPFTGASTATSGIGLKDALSIGKTATSLLGLAGAAGAVGAAGGGTYQDVPVQKYRLTQTALNPNVDYLNYGYGPEARFFDNQIGLLG